MINKGLLSTIALSQSSLCLSHTKDHCKDLREGEDILFFTLFIVFLYLTSTERVIKSYLMFCETLVYWYMRQKRQHAGTAHTIFLHLIYRLITSAALFACCFWYFLESVRKRSTGKQTYWRFCQNFMYVFTNSVK